MIPSVRKAVQCFSGANTSSQSTENLSLLFNKLCSGIDETGETDCKEAALTSLEKGISLGTFSLYNKSFSLRKKELENNSAVTCFELQLTSPLVVGMGDQNIHEFGITLQYPWGTPLIPGSAVKGALSSFAHHNSETEWQKSALAADGVAGENSRVMFGGGDEEGRANGGFLDFLDAWWVPKTTSPFKRDIITVHNGPYYRGEKGAWPDGTASPVPNGFIVVAPGECFFFSIRGEKGWRELAKKMLVKLGAECGFGAKTRVGYGRFKYKYTSHEVAVRIKAMKADELKAFIEEKEGFPSEQEDAFTEKAQELPYEKRLDDLFSRYCPVKAFLGRLEEASVSSWKEVSTIYNQLKKGLRIEVDTRDPLVQQIFALCEPLVGEQQRKDREMWLWKYAPAAVDYLTGKSADEICDFLLEYKQVYPPLADFGEAVKSLEADEKSEKEMLEYWELRMKDLNLEMKKR